MGGGGSPVGYAAVFALAAVSTTVRVMSPRRAKMPRGRAGVRPGHGVAGAFD